jgi:hypothetical protein
MTRIAETMVFIANDNQRIGGFNEEGRLTLSQMDPSGQRAISRADLMSHASI